MCVFLAFRIFAAVCLAFLCGRPNVTVVPIRFSGKWSRSQGESGSKVQFEKKQNCRRFETSPEIGFPAKKKEPL